MSEVESKIGKEEGNAAEPLLDSKVVVELEVRPKCVNEVRVRPAWARPTAASITHGDSFLKQDSIAFVHRLRQSLLMSDVTCTSKGGYCPSFVTLSRLMAVSVVELSQYLGTETSIV